MKNYLVAFIICILLSGCSQPEKASFDWSGVPADSLTSLRPVITFEEHNIANPRNMMVLSDGNLLLLDYSSNRYHILSPQYEILHTFGGEGEGPGEFMSPVEINEVNGALLITDRNTLRISRYSLSGALLGSFNYRSSAAERRAIGLRDSVYVTQSDGSDGELLFHQDLRTGTGYSIGTAKSGVFSVPDIEKGARQVRAGEIPDFMKREIFLDADSTQIYVYNKALSEQFVYSHREALTDTFKVYLPYMDDLFEMYRDQADPSSGDRGFPMLPVIDYIWDMYITSDSYWYLTKSTMQIPQQVVQYNRSGDPMHVYTIPPREEYRGIVQLAVNEESGKIYLVNYSNGTVFEAEI